MQDDEESINTNIDLEDKYENMGSDSEKEQDSDSESHSNDSCYDLRIQVKGSLHQSYGEEVERFLEGGPLERLLKPKLSMSFYLFQKDAAKTVFALYKVVSSQSSQTRSSTRRSQENPVSFLRLGFLPNRIFRKKRICDKKEDEEEE